MARQLIALLRRAKEGSRDLDWQIHAEIIGLASKGLHLPHYTTSLDAALTLYWKKPNKMPTDPIKACIEALNQRGQQK